MRPSRLPTSPAVIQTHLARLLDLIGPQAVRAAKSLIEQGALRRSAGQPPPMSCGEAILALLAEQSGHSVQDLPKGAPGSDRALITWLDAVRLDATTTSHARVRQLCDWIADWLERQA